VQNEGYSIQDTTGLIRRRVRLVSIIFLLISLLGVVTAYSLQNLYRSSGTIVIERAEVSERFLPGTYRNPNREQRIARINDEVMTRDNLAEIIEKRSLYQEERNGAPATSVVSVLRQNFQLELLFAQDDPRNKFAGEVLGFEVSFYHPNPAIARGVARDIVELFLVGNRTRRQDAYNETAAALIREDNSLSILRQRKLPGNALIDIRRCKGHSIVVRPTLRTHSGEQTRFIPADDLSGEVAGRLVPTIHCPTDDSSRHRGEDCVRSTGPREVCQAERTRRGGEVLLMSSV